MFWKLPPHWANAADDWRKTLTAFSAVIIFIGSLSTVWAAAWGPIKGYIERQNQERALILNTLEALRTENAAIREEIAILTARINSLTGEDDVLRIIPLLSYVVEPVYPGEIVTLMLMAERTTLGRDCRLIEWVPLFTDSRDIILPGSRPEGNSAPVRRQINEERTRLEIRMVPPDRPMVPGRVTVHLYLTYSCPGVPTENDPSPDPIEITQATDPIAFELLEARP